MDLANFLFVLVFSIIFFIMGYLFLLFANKDDTVGFVPHIIIGTIGLLACLIGFIGLGWYNGYKKGQINAISETKIEYQLVEKATGEKKWEKIITPEK